MQTRHQTAATASKPWHTQRAQLPDQTIEDEKSEKEEQEIDPRLNMEGNKEEHIRLKKEAADRQNFGSWGFSA
jgi:hypothetical protein